MAFRFRPLSDPSLAASKVSSQPQARYSEPVNRDRRGRALLPGDERSGDVGRKRQDPNSRFGRTQTSPNLGMVGLSAAFVKAEVPWSVRRGALSDKDRALKTVEGMEQGKAKAITEIHTEGKKTTGSIRNSHALAAATQGGLTTTFNRPGTGGMMPGAPGLDDNWEVQRGCSTTRGVQSPLLNKTPSTGHRFLPQGSRGFISGKPSALLQGSGGPGGAPGGAHRSSREKKVAAVPLAVVTKAKNPDELKKKTFSLLEDYFTFRILDKVMQCLVELKAPEYRSEFVKKTVSLALKRRPPCVVLVANLLFNLLINEVLTRDDLITGCISYGSLLLNHRLTKKRGELEKSANNFGEMLGHLVEGGVIDKVESVAENEMEDLKEAFYTGVLTASGIGALSKPIRRRSRKKRMVVARYPDQVKKKAISLVEEYFSFRILDEVMQCLEELKAPGYHSEFVEEAVSLGLEITGTAEFSGCAELLVAKLLSHLVAKKVLTRTDVITGCISYGRTVTTAKHRQAPKMFGEMMGHLVVRCIDVESVLDVGDKMKGAHQEAFFTGVTRVAGSDTMFFSRLSHWQIAERRGVDVETVLREDWKHRSKFGTP